MLVEVVSAKQIYTTPAISRESMKKKQDRDTYRVYVAIDLRNGVCIFDLDPFRLYFLDSFVVSAFDLMIQRVQANTR